MNRSGISDAGIGCRYVLSRARADGEPNVTAFAARLVPIERVFLQF